MLIDKSLPLQERQDQKISVYIASYFLVLAINASIKGVLRSALSTSLWSLLSNFFGVCLMLIMLWSLKIVFDRSSRLLFGTVFLFLILYVIGFFMAQSRGEDTSVILSIAAKDSFLFWIPVGVYAYSVRDLKQLYLILLKFSYPISICWIIYTFFNTNSDVHETYNMLFGYSLALPCMLHYVDYTQNKRIITLIFGVIEFLLIVFMGSRGPLVGLVVFILLYGFIIKGIKGTNLLFILIIGFLLLLYIDRISLFLNNFFVSQLGMSSRTLDMYLDGYIGNDSGRNHFFQAGWNQVMQKPIFGWGIGGDYNYMAYALGGNAQTVSTGVTCHNGMVQLMTYFGVIIGGVLSLMFAFLVFRAIKVYDFYSKVLICIFYSSTVFPSLWFGDGLLFKPASAVYLFLCLSINNKKK